LLHLQIARNAKSDGIPLREFKFNANSLEFVAAAGVQFLRPLRGLAGRNSPFFPRLAPGATTSRPLKRALYRAGTPVVVHCSTTERYCRNHAGAPVSIRAWPRRLCGGSGMGSPGESANQRKTIAGPSTHSPRCGAANFAQSYVEGGASGRGGSPPYGVCERSRAPTLATKTKVSRGSAPRTKTYPRGPWGGAPPGLTLRSLCVKEVPPPPKQSLDGAPEGCGALGWGTRREILERAYWEAPARARVAGELTEG
jgi:hypothetical protein